MCDLDLYDLERVDQRGSFGHYTSQMSFLDALTCSCIAAPHLLYAFIWFQPHIWRQRFGSKAVSTFADIAAALKGASGSPNDMHQLIVRRNGVHYSTLLALAVLQFSAVGLWFWVRRGSIHDLSFSAVPSLLWLPCLASVVFGQVSFSHSQPLSPQLSFCHSPLVSSVRPDALYRY